MIKYAVMDLWCEDVLRWSGGSCSFTLKLLIHPVSSDVSQNLVNHLDFCCSFELMVKVWRKIKNYYCSHIRLVAVGKQASQTEVKCCRVDAK